MSEYQFYEFLAMDRPLTDHQMKELRPVSSRAEITQTSFTVVYNYSDLRGDPLKLLERHFDVFVYVANWGTHRISVRLPARVLEQDNLERYIRGEQVTARKAGQHLIIDIRSDDEEPAGWEEGEGWMARLAPLRTELLSGDLRSLYLAWLLSVQEAYEEDLDTEEREPPVPPGLADLSGPLQALVEFLRLDEHLVEAAAEASWAEPDTSGGLAAWISGLTEEEKDRLLLAVVDGAGSMIGPELKRRFRAEFKRTKTSQQQQRTVGELLEAAERWRQEHERKRQRRLAAERKRKEARARAVKEKRLNALAGKEETAWAEVESLVASKQQSAYGQAVTMLVDLQDLAARQGSGGLFEARLEALRQAHARKYTFTKRLQKAGLS